ncbi:MAG TPA: exodeoxyribonuclease VII large subunit [Euzebya sp.]|nr:exodeoxyribonuclease VII large subunit [Euzebya sp.]
MSERTWTVAEIGARIQHVVEERMGNRFWVRGEIADLSRTSRGIVFLSLVQTDQRGQVIARLPAILSPGKARLVDRRMARVGQPLTEGIEVRIRAHLEWWTPGGRLSLALDDIDPAHTAGAMALARRDLLAQLQAEGLVGANALRPVSRLPLRLGLVTRRDSQAYHDLLDELTAAALPFEVTLVSAGVQGIHAPAELRAALQVLGGVDGLDLILLTRGGGAEVELATFDHPDVARAVAVCPLPVWTGIGHHLDTPVAEIVAARALKTPTALGQAVVATVTDAIADTEAGWQAISASASRQLRHATSRLDGATRRTQSARVALRGASGRLDAGLHRLDTAGRRTIGDHRRRLDSAQRQLHHAAAVTIDDTRRRLGAHEGLIQAYDPSRLLARGWSVTTTLDGALVRAPQPAGTMLRTTTKGGIITSEVVPTDD